jgi:hypothetical protein
MKVKDFVDTVVEGEGGAGGSLFVFDCDAGVGVSRDSFDPDYTVAGVPGMEVARGLEAAGFSVYTDEEEWREQLNNWYQMWGGSEDAW